MKRTEQINIKITPDLKKALADLARANDWTIAHTANRILEKSLGMNSRREEDDENDSERK